MLQKAILLLFALLIGVAPKAWSNEPDTAYIFCYSTQKNYNHNGLHFAWSVDKEQWHSIGPEFTFLSSDFGAWGSQKRMLTPFVYQDKDSLWHCIWSLNEEVGQIAHASSTDLIHWKRQSYPQLLEQGNVMATEVTYVPEQDVYKLTWLSSYDGQKKVYKSYTNNFKDYSAGEQTNSDDLNYIRKELDVNGEKQLGVVCKVNWSTINKLIRYDEWMKFHNQERAEITAQDAVRFKDLKDIDAEVVVYPNRKKQISDKLIGVFFEDINYAADGGLYAELVQNRGFEYDLSDKKGRDSTWTNSKAWYVAGDVSFSIDTVNALHPNNKHYALVHFNGDGAFVNEGFDGIAIKKGEKYNFSLFCRALDNAKRTLDVQLQDDAGNVLGSASIKHISSEWTKYQVVIEASKTIAASRLCLKSNAEAQLAFDMVSLFPQNTFRNRENGLRADLAQAIADLHPKFVRFPGGCVAHGDGINNIYHWKNTVGSLETRKGQRNIWNYHQSMGLGYFEYFQFCEDMGAEPLPVVAAGVPCQNSSCGGHGQQGGIPMCDMNAYIQDVLDLIEWANGDKNTKWGKVRAEAGHPKPFHLKYIGIGNEDLITDVFEERFRMIYKAVQEKYPDIIVIGTVGPFYMGTDYEEGWELATKLHVPMVDEHYYQTPGWFINNQDYYDKYDRSKPKVYLGEYAAHLPGRPMNVETALSEAIYLTSIERNADVVEMTSFAPLLAKEGHTQWNPDLIYFNNTEVKPTVDYYVQQLFGQNSGSQYIPSLIKLSDDDSEVQERVSVSVVEDEQNNAVVIKLVNILPVSVHTNLDFSGFIQKEIEAQLQVLTGKPDSKEAKPETKTIRVSTKTDYTLPPYSLSVIRVNL